MLTLKKIWAELYCGTIYMNHCSSWYHPLEILIITTLFIEIIDNIHIVITIHIGIIHYLYSCEFLLNFQISSHEGKIVEAHVRCKYIMEYNHAIE
jgi:hypothetical protein